MVRKFKSTAKNTAYHNSMSMNEYSSEYHQEPIIIEDDINNKKINKRNILDNIFSIFKIGKLLRELDQMKLDNSKLKKELDLKLSVAQLQPIELNRLINQKNTELYQINTKILAKNSEQTQLLNKIESLNEQIDELESQIVDIEDQNMYESYGLYEPRYKFKDVGEYKDELLYLRERQKSMIRNDAAALIFMQLTFNNSQAKGKASQKKNIKQLLRAFNGECEATINRVTKSNISSIEKRINNSFKQLNKLNETNGVCLSVEYLKLKLDEAYLALEYELKKEEEKEKLREQKIQAREEKKLQKEINARRMEYEKDEKHFVNATNRVNDKLQNTTDVEEIVALKNELRTLQNKLNEIHEQKEKLSNREANSTAGYVYIISNIGSFGKDVYKIGVTRRLDPMERINELSSASVPFKFDVNALVFSDNAFQLESELHQQFNDYRINRVNKRKEYFKIPIEQIRKVLSDRDELTFNFNEHPDAYEYRDTLYIEENERKDNNLYYH